MLIVDVFIWHWENDTDGKTKCPKISTATLSATDLTWTCLSLISINVLIPVDDTQKGVV